MTERHVTVISNKTAMLIKKKVYTMEHGMIQYFTTDFLITYDIYGIGFQMAINFQSLFHL
jgi:hypothetical protein